MGKLVWLSDLHVTDGKTCEQRAKLKRALTHINQTHSDAMACVISGDLVDEGRAEEYEVLKTTLAASSLPIWPVIGNHDNRRAFLSALSLPTDPKDGFVQYQIETPTHDLIVIDTNLPGDDGGVLCKDRLDWLRVELDKSNRPAILFMHHAPGVSGLGPLDAIPLYDPDPLEELLTGSRVAQICAGHVHISLNTTFAGIPLMTLRALARQNPYPWFDWSFDDVPENNEVHQYAVIQLTEHGHQIFSTDLKV